MTCEVCGKEFKTEAWLKRHADKEHTPVVTAETPVADVAKEVEPPKPVEKRAPSVLLELKGYKATEDSEGFHVVDPQGRVIGHFKSGTEAVHHLENLSRHIR
jgi:hypothetical protein